MLLDPDLADVLANVVATRPRPVEEMTLDEAREAMGALRALQGEAPQVAQVRDLAVPGGVSPIAARLFSPSTALRRPAIVFLHGGGWIRGTLDDYDVPCRRLAVATGSAVLAIDVRLAPEHRYPAALDDAVAATCFAHRAAADLGVAQGGVVLCGDSSGGNLAAACALRLRDEGHARPLLQVLIYPVTSAATDSPTYARYADGPFVTRAAMTALWRHYLGDPALATQPYASPLGADDLSDLPPALIITAEHDPLRDDGERYAKRLIDAGVPTATIRLLGLTHTAFHMSGRVPAADRIFRAVASAVATVSEGSSTRVAA